MYPSGIQALSGPGLMSDRIRIRCGSDYLQLIFMCLSGFDNLERLQSEWAGPKSFLLLLMPAHEELELLGPDLGYPSLLNR